jgi:DNA-cytosine methyltransferase
MNSMKLIAVETSVLDCPIETEDGKIILDLGDVEPSENKYEKRPLLILDPCCGCGGLCLGLKQAFCGQPIIDDHAELRQREKPQWDESKAEFIGLDISKDALRTFQHNRVGQAIRADMRSLPFRKGIVFDFIVSGPPCQGFSTINTRARMRKRRDPTYEDPRNNLIFVFADIIKKYQPAYFFFEQVPGLRSWDKGNFFRLLKYKLHEAGYHYEWRLLNYVHYGVPQSRHRIIILGWLPGMPRWFFPEPTNYCQDWEKGKGCAECGNYMVKKLVQQYLSKYHQRSMLDYARLEVTPKPAQLEVEVRA